MTIKDSISKIEWASNDYITQLSSSSGAVELQPVGEGCGRENHTRPKGLGALMSWGAEKMLIRCNKESQHSAELSSPGERERHNADGHKFGGQNIAVMFDFQLPLTRKPWTTNKVRGKYC